MARQEINLGIEPTGEGGDTAREAFTRINDMTQELYQAALPESPGDKQAARERIEAASQADVDAIAAMIGDIGSVLDAINGEAV